MLTFQPLLSLQVYLTLFVQFHQLGHAATGNEADDELRRLSNTLLNSDSNTAQVTYQLQGKLKYAAGSNVDLASQPLFDAISTDILGRSTYSKFISLLDNYLRESDKLEVLTAAEKLEENAFLDAVIKTPLMVKVKEFLQEKGKITASISFKELLQKLWFSQYSRNGSSKRAGSSGFEHVFVGEVKNRAVSGLHNWLQFYSLERNNSVDYHGFYSSLSLQSPVVLLKYKFAWDKYSKPVTTMFVGTSPEFEMALYTICFVMRPDVKCPVKIGQKNFSIRTHSLTYNGQKYIGSAYPNLGA